jgi:bifunctional UDP-N-acetylglucosamine pyrophosphorylase/glucosamine-1-phosphate N-acetyltransferase
LTSDGAPRVYPWSPLHDPPSAKATARSSARREGRHRAEADDDRIPPRIHAGYPAKADERPLAAVILAAGQGKRMKSRRPKVLHELLGRPMLAYVIDAAREVGAEPIIVVAGGATPGVRSYAEGAGARVVIQPVPKGTGDAVAKARPHLTQFDGDILILCGDAPLIGSLQLVALVERHRREHNRATILTAHVPDPTGYGRIIRGGDSRVIRIVEEADATEDERGIDEVNTGAYCIRPDALFPNLDRLTTDNRQGEYYLTDVIASLVFEKQNVGAMSLGIPDGPLGINTVEELRLSERALRDRETSR